MIEVALYNRYRGAYAPVEKTIQMVARGATCDPGVDGQTGGLIVEHWSQWSNREHAKAVVRNNEGGCAFVVVNGPTPERPLLFSNAGKLEEK